MRSTPLAIERVAQLQASGVSQRAYAKEHGFSERQVGYWVRRMTKSRAAPALLPVRVAPSKGPAVAAMSLRSERGWSLTLPSDVLASWLVELMRGAQHPADCRWVFQRAAGTGRGLIIVALTSASSLPAGSPTGPAGCASSHTRPSRSPPRICSESSGPRCRPGSAFRAPDPCRRIRR